MEKLYFKVFLLFFSFVIVVIGVKCFDFNKDVNKKIASDSIKIYDNITKIKIINYTGNIDITGKNNTFEPYLKVDKIAKSNSDKRNNYILETCSYKIIYSKDELIINTYIGENIDSLSEIEFDYELVVPESIEILIDNRIGDITITDIYNNLNISNSSGNITLNHITARDIKLSANEINAYATLYYPEDSIDWEFIGTSGNIELDLKEGISAVVEARIATGQIDYSLRDFLIQESNDVRLKGILREGEGKIFVDLITGNIKLITF